MLDGEIVVTDPPALLRVAVDLAIANDHDGQDAESTREPGPEPVPAAGLVEGAGPTENMMEEVVETVHQPPHFVMGPRIMVPESAKTDTTATCTALSSCDN
jgi:hypothetical protein